jgi:hypothetical protein
MGQAPAKTIVESVKHDGVPHYSAVGNEGERDGRSPLNEGERDSRSLLNEGKRDSRFPLNEGERDSHSPLNEGERDSHSPLNEEERDSRSPLLSSRELEGDRVTVLHCSAAKNQPENQWGERRRRQ